MSEICGCNFPFLLVLIFCTSLASSYKIVTVGSLPTARTQVRCALVEEDTVYILGGVDKANEFYFLREIVKYNITSGDIRVVARFPNGLTFGSSVSDGQGNIFYFGGRCEECANYSQKTVWKFDTRDNSLVRTTELPRSSEMWAVWDGKDNAYVLGKSFGNNVMRYTKSTNEAIRMNVSIPTADFAAVVFEPNGENLFVMKYEKIIKYNPVSGTVEELAQRMPNYDWLYAGVLAGDYIYVVGGKSGGQLVQFNPVTYEGKHFAVDGFPKNLYDHCTVYVKSLNRIYTFGGSTDFTFSKDIRYIDLN